MFIDWIISYMSDSTNRAFLVNYTGYIYDGDVNGRSGMRPYFYLKSNILYVLGDGSSGNPIVYN